MTVWVVLPSALTADADGHSELELDLDGPALTVAEVLDRLGKDLPVLERRLRDDHGTIRRHISVYLGGIDIRTLAGSETPVPDGALLQVMAAVTGG